MQSSTLYFNILIHKLWKIRFWKKLFAIRFPYKHCNFWPLCLPVKMASKTLIRPIICFSWIELPFFGKSTFKQEVWKKLGTVLFLTLLPSQKHYVIFSNNVLRENITRKQFKRWLGLVSIFPNALGYLVMRTQSKYWL